MTLTWNITWKNAIISVALPKFCNKKMFPFPGEINTGIPQPSNPPIVTPPTIRTISLISLCLTIGKNPQVWVWGLHLGVIYDPISLFVSKIFLRKKPSGPVVSKTSSYRAWPTISAAVLGKAWRLESFPTQDALQVGS